MSQVQREIVSKNETEGQVRKPLSTHLWLTHRHTLAHTYTKLKNLESLSDFKDGSSSGHRDHEIQVT